MTRRVKNLFADSGNRTDAEEFSTLFDNSSAKIERIISHSHSSPEGFWYDQAEDEWVVVLRGSAALEFADSEVVEMTEGDWFLIPRRVQHRVARTGANTVWLAVHMK